MAINIVTLIKEKLNLDEPSTWAAFTAWLAPIGITIPSGLEQAIALTLAGVTGLLAWFLRESSNKPQDNKE